VSSKEDWLKSGGGGRFAVKSASTLDKASLATLRSYATTSTQGSDEYGAGDVWDLVQNVANAMVTGRGTASSVKAAAPVASYAGMSDDAKAGLAQKVGEALLDSFSSTWSGENTAAVAAWRGYHLGTRNVIAATRSNEAGAGSSTFQADSRGETNMQALAAKYLSKTASQVTSGEQEIWNLVHGFGGQIVAKEAADKEAEAAALAKAAKPVATASSALTAAKTSTAAAGSSVVSASTAASSAAVKAAVSKAPTAASLTAAASASTAKTILGTSAAVVKTSVIKATATK